MSDINNRDRIKVAILLATYNGEKFIEQQLDSIKKQTHKNWVLCVSDDNSSDSTLQKITQFSKNNDGKVVIFNGPRKGFSQNFLSLVRNGQIQADFYAFCDQDDIWQYDKIESSLNWLLTIKQSKPAIYCSRTELIDVNEKHIGYSPLFKRKPSFKNAIVQSLAGGNTMVLNDSARKLLQKIPESANVITHDWMAYMIITACGGLIKYSAEPSLKYRQHDGNIIGSNQGIKNSYVRLKSLIQGNFAAWNQENIKILSLYESDMKKEHLITYCQFKKMKESHLFSRLFLFLKMGLYRQTLPGTIALILAVFMKKV